MGLASLSASQVSSMCRELDACVENLQSRLFGNAGFPYVFLDATYISCRDSGRVSKAALVTAIGCCSAGMRWLLGLDVVDVES
jgi:transposase-like protein